MLSGMPYASAATPLSLSGLQPQHAFHHTDYAQDIPPQAYGMLGAGFAASVPPEQARRARILMHHMQRAHGVCSASPALQQELLDGDAAEAANGKRRRAVDRRGARSTSKYRGVRGITHRWPGLV